MNIAVIGLGKLGAPLAALLAARGHSVFGADVNPLTVRRINARQPPVYEPGLDQLIIQAAGRLQATTHISEAVAQADVTFILVPTPSEADGTFSMAHVLAAAGDIGTALRRHRPQPPVVVLTSTVMPGATQSGLIPALEEASGRKCGVDLGVCYSPEFVSLGCVIDGMKNPDLLLIGESHPWAGDRLEPILQSLCDRPAPVARMGLANAELAKLAVNTYVTMKISFANMLAQLCERIPGGDVDVITAAIGHDARIGRRYLKGALGYGGPCFPRDNIALASLASQLNVSAPLPRSTQAVNKLQLRRLVELVIANLPEHGTVGILGLAYKPQTDVVDASPGLELARALMDRGVELVVFDPLATSPARKLLGGQVRFASNPGACVRGADLLVVATPDKACTCFDPQDLHREGEPMVVLDCWRTLDPELLADRCIHVPLGTALVKQRLRPAASEWRDERRDSNGDLSARTGIHGKR